MKALKEIIILTASYYGKTLSAPILEMYVDDLKEFPEEKIIAAYAAYRKNPKNKTFPLPAQIIEILSPEVSPNTQAHEIASRIRESIGRFGYSNPPEAEQYIGPIGWKIVKRMGGWSYLCQEVGLSIQPDAFFAQCREMAKSQQELDALGMVDSPELLDFKSDSKRVGALISGLAQAKSLQAPEGQES